MRFSLLLLIRPRCLRCVSRLFRSTLSRVTAGFVVDWFMAVRACAIPSDLPRGFSRAPSAPVANCTQQKRSPVSRLCSWMYNSFAVRAAVSMVSHRQRIAKRCTCRTKPNIKVCSLQMEAWWAYRLCNYCLLHHLVAWVHGGCSDKVLHYATPELSFCSMRGSRQA